MQAVPDQLIRAQRIANQCPHCGARSNANERTRNLQRFVLLGERVNDNFRVAVTVGMLLAGARIDLHGEHAIAKHPRRLAMVVCNNHCCWRCAWIGSRGAGDDDEIGNRTVAVTYWQN